MSKKLPKSLTLSQRFTLSDSPRDTLWGGTDLTRDGRTQEVRNCWAYPSINSFESSLIRLGLADRTIRGSEWSLTTLHTNNFARGFDVRTDGDDTHRYTITAAGDFGGYGTFAIQYFATGTDGALHLTTQEQSRQVGILFNKVNRGLNESSEVSKRGPTGWSKSRPLSQAPLFPDPDQPRQFGYDQALIGSTRQQTKQLLQKHGIYGAINFSVAADSLLGFSQYRESPTGHLDASDWINPSSLQFRSGFSGGTLSLKALMRRLANQADRYGINQAFLQEFFLGSAPGAQMGGGHAVAVLGWDDQYCNPTVDFTDQLINGFQKRIDNASDLNAKRVERLSTGLKGFERFLNDNAITYTNAGQESKGAWLIQNSWGSDEPGLAYQYLPYELAWLRTNKELASLRSETIIHEFDIDSADNFWVSTFHHADATGLFGPVENSSTAIVGGDPDGIWYSSGQPWHGIGYRFTPQHNAIIAIGSYLQSSVLETLTDPAGQIGYRYDPNLNVSQWLQASLWRASDLLDPERAANAQPIARSRIEAAFTGYQTVEFDQPVDLDAGEEVMATLQLYSDAAATQPISNARLLSYTANPAAVASRQKQLASPQFSNDPNKPDFYRHLPVPLLNPDPLQPLPQERFYGLNTGGVPSDLGASGQVVALNVVYTKPEAANQLLGSSDDPVISGGKQYVFTETKLQRLEGLATITHFGHRDRIILRGFDPDDLRIRQLPGQTSGVRLDGDQFTIQLLGTNSDTDQILDQINFS